MQQPPQPASGPGEGSEPASYPNLNPYPNTPQPPNQGTPGNSTPNSNAYGTPSGPPAAGPGSGFPARSGLAGMQPNSYAPPPVMPGTSRFGGVGGDGLGGEKNVTEMVKGATNVYARKFQMLLDRSTPHVVERWLVTLGLFLLFALSVILRQGWYIVAYGLAIYILNLFLAFLQPRFDPSLAEDLAADDLEEGAPGLPGNSPKSPTGLKGLFQAARGSDDEEFRPFIRRLPEFKFWYSATKATAIALVCTFTEATNLPVFWPILVVYFLTLFALTMRRQIQHMIRHRYLPFDIGKKRGYGKK